MTLQELIETELGFETQEYSGRGMYGKTCLGVTIEENLPGVLLNLGYTIREFEYDEEDPITRPSRICMDSMGLGTIVYFPNVEYVGKETECDS